MEAEFDSTGSLLRDASAGQPASSQDLLPLVYAELKHIAARHLRSERVGHTLAPTALVHEAYLRLAAVDRRWVDRKHFLSVAAIAMRRILVDHAKERNRQKRGGGMPKLQLDEAIGVSSSDDPRILYLDEALTKLSALDARKAQIIELLFFGGLTFDEVAETTGLSHATLHREVNFAKSWISSQIAPIA